MIYLYKEDKLKQLEKYKKQIILRFVIATAIYVVGVATFFIFKSMEVMYLFPILLGIYTCFYFIYLFYFLLVHFRNYKGIKRYLERLNEDYFTKCHVKIMDIDYLNYNMYGVFCNCLKTFDLYEHKESGLFIPMDDVHLIEPNKTYKVLVYMSVIVGFEESEYDG